MEPLFIQLAVMTVFGAIVSILANGRGRSPVGWFFIGAVIPCLGIILVLVLPDLNVEQERTQSLTRDNRRLRERLRKDRAVADHRHERTGGRLAAHDAMLGLDTAVEGQDRPPQLPPRSEGSRAAQVDWHYAPAGDSEPLGPVSALALRELKAAGKLDEACLFWRKGMQDWLRLEDIQELAEQLAHE